MNHGPKALEQSEEKQKFGKIQTKLTFGLYGQFLWHTNLHGHHNKAELGYDSKTGEIKKTKKWNIMGLMKK